MAQTGKSGDTLNAVPLSRRALCNTAASRHRNVVTVLQVIPRQDLPRGGIGDGILRTADPCTGELVDLLGRTCLAKPD